MLNGNQYNSEAIAAGQDKPAVPLTDQQVNEAFELAEVPMTAAKLLARAKLGNLLSGQVVGMIPAESAVYADVVERVALSMGKVAEDPTRNFEERTAAANSVMGLAKAFCDLAAVRLKLAEAGGMMKKKESAKRLTPQITPGASYIEAKS